LQRVAVAARCSMLQYDQCVVVCDSALQLVEGCCRADQAVARQVSVAAHCNTLQHTATPVNVAHYLAPTFQMFSSLLQHAATQNNTLQHLWTEPSVWRQHCRCPHRCCNTLQKNATHCNSLQHTAMHCNALQQQHTATHCNTLQQTTTHCNTLQHTATHCNILQHTATHCSTCGLGQVFGAHIPDVFIFAANIEVSAPHHLE